MVFSNGEFVNRRNWAAANSGESPAFLRSLNWLYFSGGVGPDRGSRRVVYDAVGVWGVDPTPALPILERGLLAARVVMGVQPESRHAIGSSLTVGRCPEPVEGEAWWGCGAGRGAPQSGFPQAAEIGYTSLRV